MNHLLSIAAFLLIIAFASAHATESYPNFGTGIKIGEVSQNQAIIWARLCDSGPEESKQTWLNVPGMPGTVQVAYWPEHKPQNRTLLKPKAVNPEEDFTTQIQLKNLSPNTTYSLGVTAYSETGSKGQELQAGFKTAPDHDDIEDVTAVIVTCQGHETIDDPVMGHWAYAHMLTHNPDFFIHTGDVVYYDREGILPFSKTVEAARQRWNAMFAYEWNRNFHSQVSSYFMKDDHDTLKNDCWPGQSYGDIQFEDGLALFKEQTPQGPLPYRSVRWGKDLEFWLIEGRDFRTPNNAPDGPNKTILGDEQMAWLKQSLEVSDASFKLVVFPSPVVGPDKKGKSDNHSNHNFAYEGRMLREFLASIPNTFVVCGDRHWQYASKDPITGLIEICCGPINNEHAKIGGNADKNKDYHLYYGGGKGGYLRVLVTRVEDLPKISFIWHGDQSSNGDINHKLVFHSKE